MARGKYAARATGRRDAQETATTIETYQRNVAKLAAERDDLKAKLAQEQRERAAERRALKAMIAEGVAPELAARDAVIESLRTDLGEARSALKEHRRVQEKTARFLHARLIAAGMTTQEAIEWMFNSLGESFASEEGIEWSDRVLYHPDVARRQSDPAAVVAIHKAKGIAK
jgi:uncharacterized coiled-coil DUF342 family protein